VIDPRTGEPVAAGSALVCGPDATTCDALSTALVVCGAPGLAALARRFPRYRLHIT
jgi:thiamine biosynthesis lipoprotein ApbE